MKSFSVFLVILFTAVASFASNAYVCSAQCLKVESKSDGVNPEGSTEYVRLKVTAMGKGPSEDEAWNDMKSDCFQEKKGTHLFKKISSSRIILHGATDSVEILTSPAPVRATSKNSCHPRMIGTSTRQAQPADVADKPISPTTPSAPAAQRK